MLLSAILSTSQTVRGAVYSGNWKSQYLDYAIVYDIQ